jgi:hypothetical protein
MIAAILTLAPLVLVFLYFGIRGAQSKQDIKRTLPALLTLVMMAIVTIFFAFGSYLDTRLPARLEPIETQADYEASSPLDPGFAIVIGEAYTFTPVRTMPMFDVVVPDGILSFPTGVYNDVNWDLDENDSHYLDAGSPVVVQLRVRDDHSVYAQTIFQGTHQEYLDYLPSLGMQPLIAFISAIILGIITIGIPWWKYRQLPD